MIVSLRQITVAGVAILLGASLALAIDQPFPAQPNALASASEMNQNFAALAQHLFDPEFGTVTIPTSVDVDNTACDGLTVAMLTLPTSGATYSVVMRIRGQLAAGTEKRLLKVYLLDSDTGTVIEGSQMVVWGSDAAEASGTTSTMEVLVLADRADKKLFFQACRQGGSEPVQILSDADGMSQISYRRVL